MSDSLRELLLKSGIAKIVPKAPRAPGQGPRREPRAKAAPRDGKPKTRGDGEIDLARAYAIRNQTEARERAQQQREAEQKARARKEARQKLGALLKGKEQNKADAEAMRHFEYRGKIRRVHVDADQLAALNIGKLGVVQFGGRYLIVAAELARAAGAIDAEALALLVDPDQAADTDEGVPDDLVW